MSAGRARRVLVTGGAGFIGSHLSDALLAQGDRVTVIDDLSAGDAARLDPRVAFARIDITSYAELASAAVGAAPEVIFHLAAQVDVRRSVADPNGDAAANIGGTINVLEAARATGAKVVFASTGGAMYGLRAPVPSAEDVQAAPEAPYGTAKYCAEQYLGLYNRLYGTRHAALRLGNVYGPRQGAGGEVGVVAIFCGRAVARERTVIFGDGTQTRDYVYVRDVVDAFLSAADASEPGIWNIGSGTETSVLELAAAVGEAAGHDPRLVFLPSRPGELPRSALDTASAASELNWKAATSLGEGIAAVYEWVRSGRPDRGRC